MHLPTPVRGWRKSGRTMKMKRVITFGVLLAGLCAPPAVAQTSQRLLNSLSAGLGGLECGIAGPTVERLRRGDLLRSLEQGVGAIRSRHDSEDDGAPPSLRVVDGRPRIEPGGRLTLRRGSLLVDGIWDGLGPGDSTDDLLRDARRFLDAGIIDGDDDESIAVLERAVLTQAFAYAVNFRVAGLCGTTVGGAGGVVAGGVGGVRRPASSAGAVQPAVAVPADAMVRQQRDNIQAQQDSIQAEQRIEQQQQQEQVEALQQQRQAAEQLRSGVPTTMDEFNRALSSAMWEARQAARSCETERNWQSYHERGNAAVARGRSLINGRTGYRQFEQVLGSLSRTLDQCAADRGRPENRPRRRRR